MNFVKGLQLLAHQLSEPLISEIVIQR
jgi:hypothetical protein